MRTRKVPNLRTRTSNILIKVHFLKKSLICGPGPKIFLEYIHLKFSLKSDAVALALYYLTCFHLNEIIKGLCRKGAYNLRPEYQHFKMDENYCNF